MKVGQLLILVAIVGTTLGGLVLFARSTRGNRHWVMSIQDQPGGMLLLIGTAIEEIPKSIESPDYTVKVKGYSLGRDEKPFLLDGVEDRLPAGIIRTFHDTTILPGACRLSIGPLFLDFHEAFLKANGAEC